MTNDDTEKKSSRRFTISKECIMIKNNEKRPMVKIQWRDGGKTMCKSFSIGKRRNQEQAMEEAKKYYDEKVKPKYDEWKLNYDKETKEIKKEKKRNWKKTPFKCECGIEINRSSKARHMKSDTHIKKILLNKQKGYHIRIHRGTNKRHTMTESNRRYKCECGSDVDISAKKAHFKSKKHNKFIEKQEEERKKQEEWEIRRQAKKNTTDDDWCNFCHYREYNCHCGSGYGKYY